jgi:hypothetical protein
MVYTLVGRSARSWASYSVAVTVHSVAGWTDVLTGFLWEILLVDELEYSKDNKKVVELVVFAA